MTPQRAQPVVVHIPGREDMRAYIDDVDAQELTLVLAVRTDSPKARLGDEAVVEYHTASGIHRLRGQVHDDQVDPTVLKVRRHPPEDEVIQRRAWARVDASVPIDVCFEHEATGTRTTVSVNLSGGGALLREDTAFEIGDVVRLRIQLDATLVQAAGIVVRETTSGEKGVCITQIAEADRERIVRYVAVRQREELARRRVRP